jgi:leader peptidase (prepilin peptidase)/N-methyltransferase
MPSYQLYMLAAQSMWVLFIFAIGACVGSLTNVLVYRLPLGMSVVTPPSRCPACDTRLTWRENIPIFGWLFLRGRCRFCKSSISPEYPLVELFVALLFSAFFLLYYTVPVNADFLGINWGAISPEWARADASDAWPRSTWPIFIVLLVLLGSLVAMTIVDAKTFTIPLEIPWFATATALIFHVGYAAYLSWQGHGLPRTAPGTSWAIPLPGWSPSGNTMSGAASWWLGASLFATLGLVISNLLLKFNLIPRSFADYPQWEERAIAEAQARAAAVPTSPKGEVRPQAGGAGEGAPAFPSASPPSPLPSPSASLSPPPQSKIQNPKSEIPAPTSPDADLGSTWRSVRAASFAFAIMVILTAAGRTFAPAAGFPQWSGFLLGLLALPIVYAITIRMMERGLPHPDSQPGDLPPDMWIQYPHARREMLKEVLFLAPPIALAFLGGWLFQLWLAPRPTPPAMWIMVLGGVLQGYLIAGAIVWAVRILGSLGFGKEAMGLGDVHLLAAVGACLGWVDAALAFPLAAVVGLFWVIVSMVRTGGAPRAMPFGPYLAGATLLVILCKPLIEMGLTWLMAVPEGMRPINLP